ncbi:hypothetical protein ABVT39_021328 [Epinephelus coioides]
MTVTARAGPRHSDAAEPSDRTTKTLEPEEQQPVPIWREYLSLEQPEQQRKCRRTMKAGSCHGQGKAVEDAAAAGVPHGRVAGLKKRNRKGLAEGVPQDSMDLSVFF